MRPIVRRAARGVSCLVLVAALSGCPSGWSASAQESAASVFTTASVELRARPGYDAPALATLGVGEAAAVAGAVEMAADGTAWVPVVAAGQSGYLPAGIVSGTAPPSEAPQAGSSATLQEAAPATAEAMDVPSIETLAPPVPEPPVPSSATTGDPTLATTSDVNLRSGPSPEAEVLRVLSPGTSVVVDGNPVNGFVPVTVDGTAGWVAAEFLGGEGSALPADDFAAASTSTEATPPPSSPTPAAEVRATPEATTAPEVRGTGIAWPFRGGTWQVIQGYNGGTHQNRSAFAQYYYALDWALVDGDTAGQPVYAPVSGTVEWVDRGSGGLLIDAGNGYGVAMFHLTIDGGFGSGQAVERGQRLGVISGPGGPGYASTPHVDLTCWQLGDGGHVSVPFAGPNAISGREFPDIGGSNQYLGTEVTP